VKLHFEVAFPLKDDFKPSDMVLPLPATSLGYCDGSLRSVGSGTDDQQLVHFALQSR
jgi:hypothetical protein